MVIRVGLEPTTPSLRGSCSNQLSYRTILVIFLIIPRMGDFEKSGGEEWKSREESDKRFCDFKRVEYNETNGN